MPPFNPYEEEKITVYSVVGCLRHSIKDILSNRCRMQDRVTSSNVLKHGRSSPYFFGAEPSPVAGYFGGI